LLRAILSLTTLLAALAQGSVRDVPPADSLDEVVVSGERAGPGLWHVQGHGGEAWILGTISPLPRDIRWRSHDVETTLAKAKVVLVGKPFEINIFRVLWLFITERSLLMVPGGRTVGDVMPPQLYARLATLRSKYAKEPNEWARYRPIIATAFLERAALHQAGLSARLEIGAEVRELARKHDVRVEEVKVAGLGDFLAALKAMPPATEEQCVAGALATIETGLPRLVARAQAWVTGDVERIQSLPEPGEVDSCVAALSASGRAADLLAQIRGTWLDALEAHLTRGEPTLAVINMDLLLQPGGLLEELRTAGYTVDAP
jgi:uncharacterized protein YbaP (TraB family)